MANQHLATAHNYGVKKALEECGYKTAEDVAKDVQELGLTPQEQPKTAAPSTENAFVALKNKPGR